MSSDVIVVRVDGRKRQFFTRAANEWYRGRVSEEGVLTIYREWDGGMCVGALPVASFAKGIWVECIEATEGKELAA